MYDGSTNEARLNRELLCRELRENPPADWFYDDTRTCALAVAKRLGLLSDDDFPARLGMDRWIAECIFLSPYGSLWTAEMVARKIEVAPYV